MPSRHITTHLVKYVSSVTARSWTRGPHRLCCVSFPDSRRQLCVRFVSIPALVICRLTTLQLFLMHKESVTGTSLQYLRIPVLLDLDTHSSRCGTVSTAITEDDTVFMKELNTDVEVDHHEQNINTLGNHTADVFFNHLEFRRTITVGGDRAVLSGIMQIATSAVRDAYIVFSAGSCHPRGLLWLHMRGRTPVRS